ncbi:MAG: hypothetical protein ABIL58_11455 [Pseudomonadota bacterium]
MDCQPQLRELDSEIRALKQCAERLYRTGESIPAVRRNTARILASVKMLELNICDLLDCDDNG